MRWWTCLFVLAVIIESESHPLEDVECCPCPKAGDSTVGGAGVASARGDLGDCPCLPGSPDSEGAPSILTHTAVRAARPFLNSRPEPKEDVKPLLHPEVDLASSVLNTLREATEEEYRDAVARDAARSVAREADAEEPAANVINIIVSPKPTADNEEDAISEASHVQEARCIPSLLGKSSSRKTLRKPPSLLKDIFGLRNAKPLGLLHRNVFDMDNAPSDIHEQVLESVNNELKGLKLKSNPSLLNLFPNKREPTSKHTLGSFMTFPKFRNNNENDYSEKVFGNVETKVFSPLKSNSKKIKVDAGITSSSIDEGTDLPVKNMRSKVTLKVPENVFKNTRKPLGLQNILNLKDVEMIPTKKITIPRLALPDLKLPSLKMQPKSRSKTEWKEKHRINNNSEDDDDNDCKENVQKSNIQTIPKRKVQTEIIDAAPSPSQNQELFFNDNGESGIMSTDQKHKADCISSTENVQLNDEPTFNNFSKSNKEINSEEIDEISAPVEFVNKFDETEQAEDVDSEESQFEKESTKSQKNPSTSMPEQESNEVNNEDACNDATVLQPAVLKQDTEEKIDGNDNESSKPLSLDDLQAMSDALLDASATSEKASTPDKPVCKVDSSSNKDTSIESSEETPGNSLKDDNETQKESDTDDLKSNENNSDESSQNEGENEPAQEQQASSLNQKNIDPCGEFVTTTTMSTILEENKRSNEDCVKQEMSVAASDPVKDTVSRLFPSTKSPKSSIGQSFIVQPTSLINSADLDFLRPIEIGNILNFNSNLPTLEELRSRVSSILGMGINLAPAEQESVEESSELESDFTNNNPVMSPAASEPKSSLASLGPLEDINLDIFQVKPLGMSKGSPLPGLNLNAFKAKLPISKSMEVKPLRLETRVGNKDTGILGSTLTFGPRSMSLSKNSEFDILKSPTNLMESFNLGKPMGTFNLDKLRSSLRSDAKSLLSSPRLSSSRNAVLNKPTNSFSENLKSHSDNAVRNVQKTLTSTFNDRSVLSSPLPKPEHILGMVSQAHNDVNDKLKEMHSDLNDHITSFRDRILDNTNTRNKSPVLGKSNFKSSLPRTHTKVLESLPKGFGKTKSRTSTKSSSSRTIDRMNRLHTAASVPVPKTVQVPELKKSSEDTLLRPRESALKRKLETMRPLSEKKSALEALRLSAADRNKSPLIKPFKPLGEFKVSFATTSTSTTTPRSPLFKKRLTITTTTKKPSLLKSRLDLSNLNKRPSLTRDSLKLSKLKTQAVKEPSSSPSQKVSAKSSATDSIVKTVPEKTLKTKEIKSQKEVLKNAEPAKVIWPKLGDDSFLTKVREAVRARLAELSTPKVNDKKPESKATARSRGGSDLSSAGSEVVERKSSLKSNAPLKENVTYKCKLVCVKEVKNSEE